MSDVATFNLIMKHVWTEPKFQAEVEWFYNHPGPVEQMIAAVGRPAAEHYVETGRWPEGVADVEVEVVLEEWPDFDWWEPRHDQPWRREHARSRELDRLLDRK